jgi:AWS domain
MDHERKRRKKRPAVWQLVRENIYTHRRRKEQDEDDIMICQCRRPSDGGVGCGADCLNRLLNIECVPVSAGQYVDDGFCGADCPSGCFAERPCGNAQRVSLCRGTARVRRPAAIRCSPSGSMHSWTR